MKRFLRSFTCCGSINQTNSSAVSRARDIMRDPNQDQQNLDRQIEIAKQKKLVKIDSKFCSDNLSCADFRPESGEQLKYNCPICFRFFDQILVTTCCKNYLCHFCIDEMNEKMLKEKTVVDNPRCPFCNDENIGLHDVDPKEKPKRYTDSPAATILSKNHGSFQQTENLRSRFHTQTKGQGQENGITTQSENGVMRLDFANHKVDRSRAESENPLDYSLHQEYDNINIERCPSEPLPLDRDTEVNIVAMRLSLLEFENGRQDSRPQKNMNRATTILNHSVIMEEVEVEASPQKPNNIDCKISYPGITNEFLA